MDAKTQFVIGQECICPDGLGRVRKVVKDALSLGKVRVYVDTYIDNRACGWAGHNVELIPLSQAVKPASDIPMRRYTMQNRSSVVATSMYSNLTLQAINEMTDWTEQELDYIASMAIGESKLYDTGIWVDRTK